MADLTTSHPARDGTAPLLTEERVQDLLQEVPDWTVKEGKLTRDIQVKNFAEGLALVNKIGDEAERENHHPDICLHSWNHVRLELYTHTVQGLSQNDFVMAARFDRILEAGARERG